MPDPYEKRWASCNGTYICTSLEDRNDPTYYSRHPHDGEERDGVKQQNESHTHTDDVQKKRA